MGFYSSCTFLSKFSHNAGGCSYNTFNIVSDAETKQKYVVGVLDAAAGLGLKKMNIVTVSSL